MWTKSHQLVLVKLWHLSWIHGFMEPRGSVFVSISARTFRLLACGCQHKADVSKVVPRQARLMNTNGSGNLPRKMDHSVMVLAWSICTDGEQVD